MLVGNYPFFPGRGGSIEDLVTLINKGDLIFPEEIKLSNQIKILLKKMLMADAKKRIGFEEFFNNSWITGVTSILEQSNPLKDFLKSVHVDPSKKITSVSKNPRNNEKELMILKFFLCKKFIEYFNEKMEQFYKKIELIFIDYIKINENFHKESASIVKFLLITLALSKIKDLFNLNFKLKSLKNSNFDVISWKKINANNNIFSLDLIQKIKEKVKIFYEILKNMEKEIDQKNFEDHCCEELLYKKILDLGKFFLTI